MHLTQKMGSVGILATLLTLSIGHGMAHADTPGQHPHYLHARSDLRRAERLLKVSDESNVVRDLRRVDYEVDAAVREIDRAALIDRKNLDYNPTVDVSLKGTDRLHAVLKLLRSAHYDLTHYSEDNRRDLGWRRRTVIHIDRAINSAKKALHDDYADDHGA